MSEETQCGYQWKCDICDKTINAKTKDNLYVQKFKHTGSLKHQKKENLMNQQKLVKYEEFKKEIDGNFENLLVAIHNIQTKLNQVYSMFHKLDEKINNLENYTRINRQKICNTRTITFQALNQTKIEMETQIKLLDKKV